MDCIQNKIKSIKKKRDEGASSIFMVIFFFLLMSVALVIAFAQWRSVKLKVLNMQDGLAAACLAAAVPDVYATSGGDLYIPAENVPYSYELFKESLRTNLLIKEDSVNHYVSASTDATLEGLTVSDFRIYSIITNAATGKKEIHQYKVNPNTGLIYETSVHAYTDNEDMALQTPNGRPVVWTTVYAKLDISMETAALKFFLGDDSAGINASIEKVSAIVKDSAAKVIAHDWRNPNDDDNEKVVMVETFGMSATEADVIDFLTKAQARLSPKTNPDGTTGYEFVGWSLGSDDIIELIDNGNAVIDVYAVYRDISGDYSTIKVFDGEKIDTYRIENGNTLSISAKEVPGKMFLYWAFNEEGTVLASNDKNIVITVTNNAELWAIYSYTDAGDVADISDTVTTTADGFKVDTKWYVKNTMKKTKEVGFLLGTEEEHLDYNHELVLQAGQTVAANVGSAITDIAFYDIVDRTLYGRSYLIVEDIMTGAVEILYGPTHELEYKATNANQYNVYVGGVRVTDANANDILGDGGSAKFNLYNRTLTLNECSTANTYKIGGVDYGIYTDTHMIINLVGDNSIEGAITNGDGSALTINDITPEYIYADANISVNGEIKVNVINNAKINNAKVNGLIENNKIIAGGEYEMVLNTKNGEIAGGYCKTQVINYGSIRGGVFDGKLYNESGAYVKGGVINAQVFNSGSIASDQMTSPTIHGEIQNTGNITGGTIAGDITSIGRISGGNITGDVMNGGTISGGVFSSGTVRNTTVSEKKGTIAGGEFTAIVFNETGTISNGNFKNLVVNNTSATILASSGLHKITTLPQGECFVVADYTLQAGESFWSAMGTNIIVQAELQTQRFYLFEVDGITVGEEVKNNPLKFYMPSNDVTITATGAWVATFNPNKGTPESELVRLAGEKLGALPIVQRKGYTQTGWYTALTGGTKISENTLMPSRNITYYAQWTPNYYPITWDANGGSAVAAWSSPYESRLGTLPTTTRTGYKFLGWYTAKTGGTKISSSTLVPFNGATYYAQWEALPYTYNIVYVSESGLQLGTATVTYNYDTTNIIYPKSFPGYNTPASQSIAWDSTTAKTITFTYDIIDYTITYTYGSGGTAIGNKTSYTVETAEFSISRPQRPGYKFNGYTEQISTQEWFAGFINLDTGVYENSTQYPNSVYSGRIRLEAGIKYTLNASNYNSQVRWRVYALDGTYIGNGSSSTTYTPTSDCYVRILFHLGCSGTDRNAAYLSSPANLNRIVEKGSTGNRKYVADYTQNTYNLTYSLGGGNVSTANPTTYKVDTAKFTLNNPTRTNYTFLGWTEQIKTSTWYSGWVNESNGAVKYKYDSYPDAVYSEPIYLESGVAYKISGTSLGNIRWRFYDTSGAYIGSTSGTTFTPSQNGYVRILLINGATETNRNAAIISSSQGKTVPIVKGSTGNRTYVASLKVDIPPLADLSVEANDFTNPATSSGYWDLSNASSVTFNWYHHAGYGRWMGDGSASSYDGYLYLQFADGTTVSINHIYLGGGTDNWGEVSSGSTPLTINLDGYTAAQKAQVKLGATTYGHWNLATGMYNHSQGTATGATAE